jgi:bacterioferritin (cytochrome b1)
LHIEIGSLSSFFCRQKELLRDNKIKKEKSMKKSELIEMLNKDMADEHAAIIRYIVHGWMEGEDSPIGSSLLSRSREEMWHMHWLGMSIGKLGGEPNFKPAPYPYDPTNRSTIFRSYVEYEEKLIPHYTVKLILSMTRISNVFCRGKPGSRRFTQGNFRGYMIN